MDGWMDVHLPTTASPCWVCFSTLGTSSHSSWLKWRPQTWTWSQLSSPQNETTLLWGLFSGLSWGKSLCRRLEWRSLSGPQTPWLCCLDVRWSWLGPLQPQQELCGSLSWPTRCRSWSVVFCLIPFLILFVHLWTPRAPHLIPLSSLVSYCVNGIKNSKPMPEEG